MAIKLRVRPVDWDLNLDLKPVDLRPKDLTISESEDLNLEKEDLPLWDLTTSLTRRL